MNVNPTQPPNMTTSELLERSEEITGLLADVIGSYGVGEDYIQHTAANALFQHIKLQQDIRREIENLRAVLASAGELT